ncbi:hypothetical protein BGZ73_007438 [Actinomortierella ambigua]|nr:hypothetical protein BGZ73_007438 [Actinomortierella ambigua]
MKSNVVAFFLVLLCLVTYVNAWKCACNGGTANSKRACANTGHIYGVYGCGFTGCCVHTHEIQGFKDECNRLGYGFKRCDDCAQC